MHTIFVAAWMLTLLVFDTGKYCFADSFAYLNIKIPEGAHSSTDRLLQQTREMVSSSEILALVLVGAFWGCTNPLMRQGSQNVASQQSSALSKWLNVRVWLPYAVNQSGSLLFYYTLGHSDLSLAVPICNGLALVFSIFTSYWIGEPMNDSWRIIVGSACVVAGVTVCLTAREDT